MLYSDSIIIPPKKIDPQGRILFPQPMLDAVEIGLGTKVRKAITATEQSLLIMSVKWIEKFIESFEKNVQGFDIVKRDKLLRTYSTLLYGGEKGVVDENFRIRIPPKLGGVIGIVPNSFCDLSCNEKAKQLYVTKHITSTSGK